MLLQCHILMYLYAFCISKRECTKSILIKGAKNAKCYFFKNFFSTLNDKNTPTSNMLNLKNLALSYGRISFLRPYCSKVLEFFNTFFVLSLPLSRVSGFSLSLSLSLSNSSFPHHHTLSFSPFRLPPLPRINALQRQML